MYRPAAFAEDRPDVLAGLIDRIGFAHLVTAAGGLAATPLPLLRVPAPDGPGRLVGHVARANPQWRDLPDGAEALAIFTGADGYISPSWYPSKAEHGKVVPTWNYVAVHAHGTVTVHDDPAWKLDLVTRLTDRHEADRAEPWAVSDAPADFVEQRLRAIVGVELRIDRLEGKRKLSQNRPADDVAGVLAGLDADGDPQGTAVAAEMRTAAADG
ncbi:MAG: FMN-binding negative transcriptional regulator [Actinomycetota bacterium]|nr:FMN-binding negative transcriptional regulator [Actinomycetota bacterium]